MFFPHTWNNGMLGVTAAINHMEYQKIPSNPSFRYFNILPPIGGMSEKKYIQTGDNPIKM
jgi:hypothetical protein